MYGKLENLYGRSTLNHHLGVDLGRAMSQPVSFTDTIIGAHLCKSFHFDWIIGGLARAGWRTPYVGR